MIETLIRLITNKLQENEIKYDIEKSPLSNSRYIIINNDLNCVIRISDHYPRRSSVFRYKFNIGVHIQKYKQFGGEPKRFYYTENDYNRLIKHVKRYLKAI